MKNIKNSNSCTAGNAVPKIKSVAYLLFIVLGALGVHRLYLNKTTTATIQLSLFIIGVLTSQIFGALFHILLVTWLICDMTIIKKEVNKMNKAIEEEKAIFEKKNEDIKKQELIRKRNLVKSLVLSR